MTGKLVVLQLLLLYQQVDEIENWVIPENKLNVFPNPNTGNCYIRYYVSENSKCEIAVYDMLGRQIAMPLSEFKTSGFHQLSFNYGNLTNGLYFIKFTNNNQTYTVKSVLSR